MKGVKYCNPQDLGDSGCMISCIYRSFDMNRVKRARG